MPYGKRNTIAEMSAAALMGSFQRAGSEDFAAQPLNCLVIMQEIFDFCRYAVGNLVRLTGSGR